MKSIPNFPEKLAKVFEFGACLREDGYRGRFAPSPSGPLHLGNFRTALISWLIARINGGKWILRIDDIDSPRIRSGSIQKIQEDLNWLGITWDGPIIYQSNRQELYNAALEYFKVQGKLYACNCSRKRQSNIYMKKGYNQICNCKNLGLSWEKNNGKIPSLKLITSQDFSLSLDDVIVRRADNFISYNLATVIDELALGITEIVRGNDLIKSMNSQLAVFESLKQSPIPFRHIPLLLNPDLTKISKREGANCIDYYKDKGINASMLIGWLAATIGLVPFKSKLTSLDLLYELKHKRDSSDIYSLFNKCSSHHSFLDCI